MSAKQHAWCVLCSIWIRGDPCEWEEIERIVAEAQGTVLLTEALESDRRWIYQPVQEPRLIGDDS